MFENLGRSTHACLRAGAGLLFLQHGLQKIFGMFGGIGGPGATVPMLSQLGAAGMLELVGGTLLVIGLFTRPVSAVLLIEMMVAYFQVHAPQGGWPIQNQGELAVLYGLIFLYLLGCGAGAFSADAWIFARGLAERRLAVADRRRRESQAWAPVH